MKAKQVVLKKALKRAKRYKKALQHVLAMAAYQSRSDAIHSYIKEVLKHDQEGCTDE